MHRFHRPSGASATSEPRSCKECTHRWLGAAAALGMWLPRARRRAPTPRPSPPPRGTGSSPHVAAYTVPDVELVRDDGKTVRLGQELDDGGRVLSFIFTSCTTVCR